MKKLCKKCGYIVGHPNKEVMLIGGDSPITDVVKKLKKKGL